MNTVDASVATPKDKRRSLPPLTRATAAASASASPDNSAPTTPTMSTPPSSHLLHGHAHHLHGGQQSPFDALTLPTRGATAARRHSLAVTSPTASDMWSRSAPRLPAIGSSATGSGLLGPGSRRDSLQGTTASQFLKQSANSLYRQQQQQQQPTAAGSSVTSSHDTLSRAGSQMFTAAARASVRGSVHGLVEGMEAKLRLAESNFAEARRSQESLDDVRAGGAAPLVVVVPGGAGGSSSVGDAAQDSGAPGEASSSSNDAAVTGATAVFSLLSDGDEDSVTASAEKLRILPPLHRSHAGSAAASSDRLAEEAATIMAATTSVSIRPASKSFATSRGMHPSPRDVTNRLADQSAFPKALQLKAEENRSTLRRLRDGSGERLSSLYASTSVSASHDGDTASLEGVFARLADPANYTGVSKSRQNIADTQSSTETKKAAQSATRIDFFNEFAAKPAETAATSSKKSLR